MGAFIDIGSYNTLALALPNSIFEALRVMGTYPFTFPLVFSLWLFIISYFFKGLRSKTGWVGVQHHVKITMSTV